MKYLVPQQWVIITTLFQVFVFLPSLNFVNCAQIFDREPNGQNLTSLWQPPPIPKSARLDTCEIIQKYSDCQCEKHEVELCGTGYFVTIFRIVPKPGNKNNGEVVYLQHGLFCSSDDWVSGNPYPLPLHLCDQGYEVWLGNIRGNTYGLKHSSLKFTDAKFWEFTRDDISKDLKCLTNYILLISGKLKFFYVGHSMGCAMFFIFNHYFPTFVQEKCKGMAALSPAVFVSNAFTPIVLFSLFPPLFRETFADLMASDPQTMLAANKVLQDNAATFCGSWPMSLCGTVLSFLTGSDCSAYSNEKMGKIMTYSPSSSGPYLLNGYLSEINTGNFAKYDYGILYNWVVYGFWSPPSYDLTRCETDVLIIYGGKDSMTVTKDCLELKKKLTSATVTDHFIEDYNHVDPLFADDAYEKCYTHISDYFKELSQSDAP